MLKHALATNLKRLVAFSFGLIAFIQRELGKI
jgi:hypothetical protein